MSVPESCEGVTPVTPSQDSPRRLEELTHKHRGSPQLKKTHRETYLYSLKLLLSSCLKVRRRLHEPQRKGSLTHPPRAGATSSKARRLDTAPGARHEWVKSKAGHGVVGTRLSVHGGL